MLMKFKIATKNQVRRTSHTQGTIKIGKIGRTVDGDKSSRTSTRAEVKRSREIFSRQKEILSILENPHLELARC